jgi:hypothetical protein
MYIDDAIEITSGMNESPFPVASADEKWTTHNDTKANGGSPVGNCFSFRFYFSLVREFSPGISSLLLASIGAKLTTWCWLFWGPAGGRIHESSRTVTYYYSGPLLPPTRAELCVNELNNVLSEPEDLVISRRENWSAVA